MNFRLFYYSDVFSGTLFRSVSFSEFMRMFWTTCTDYIKRDSCRLQVNSSFVPRLFCEDCIADF